MDSCKLKTRYYVHNKYKITRINTTTTSRNIMLSAFIAASYTLKITSVLYYTVLLDQC